MTEDDDRESLPERVDPEEARELIAGGRVRVIDVRSADEFAEERISGSVHAEPDELEGGVGADRAGRDSVLVVCADGEESAELAESLRSGGTDATSIEGGFPAWVNDGQPTAPGRDEEYDGPAVTLPGAVASKGDEGEDSDQDEDSDGSSGEEEPQAG
jgi:rhodanese-related sulfurtransferase